MPSLTRSFAERRERRADQNEADMSLGKQRNPTRMQVSVYTPRWGNRRNLFRYIIQAFRVLDRRYPGVLRLSLDSLRDRRTEHV